jgi:hypothetical protein
MPISHFIELSLGRLLILNWRARMILPLEHKVCYLYAFQSYNKSPRRMHVLTEDLTTVWIHYQRRHLYRVLGSFTECITSGTQQSQTHGIDNFAKRLASAKCDTQQRKSLPSTSPSAKTRTWQRKTLRSAIQLALAKEWQQTTSFKRCDSLLSATSRHSANFIFPTCRQHALGKVWVLPSLEPWHSENLNLFFQFWAPNLFCSPCSNLAYFSIFLLYFFNLS